MLILPEWSFQFGGRNVVLKNIAVGLENNRLVPYAGNIGMALINQFDKVTINFDKCFVILSKMYLSCLACGKMLSFSVWVISFM